jgi:hypothetical protein
LIAALKGRTTLGAIETDAVNDHAGQAESQPKIASLPRNGGVFHDNLRHDLALDEV